MSRAPSTAVDAAMTGSPPETETASDRNASQHHAPSTMTQRGFSTENPATVNGASKATTRTLNKPKSRRKETGGIYAPSFHEASTDALALLAAKHWPIPELKSRPAIEAASSATNAPASATAAADTAENDEAQQGTKKAKGKKGRKGTAKQPDPDAMQQSIWNPDLVRLIWTELVKSGFSRSKVMLLEYLQTLENYLWPHYDPEKALLEHTLSIVVNINEKFREKQFSVWNSFLINPETDAVKFAGLFRNVTQLLLTPLDMQGYSYHDKSHTSTRQNDIQLDLQVRSFLLVFLIYCFASLETAIVRTECLKLAGVATWKCLVNDKARDLIFNKAVQTRKLWNRAEKKYQSASVETQNELDREHCFISELIKHYYTVLDSIPETGDVPPPPHAIAYCERFVEFLIDLESQLPTRRYLNTLLHDHLVFTVSSRSNLAKRGRLYIQQNRDITLSLPEDWDSNNVNSGALYTSLLEKLSFYANFEIDDFAGTALSQSDITHAHYERIQSLQRLAFTEFKDTLEEFALENVGSVDTAVALKAHLEKLNDDRLKSLCHILGVRTEKFWSSKNDDDHDHASMKGVVTYLDKEFLVDVLIERYKRRESHLDEINAMSLYPDENVLFDDSTVPDPMTFTNTHCLAIPKLNLQFLTLHDYLLRNFELFRLESNYEIRQDIEDVIKRMGPTYNSDVQTPDHATLRGWARMGIAVKGFTIADIGPPRLGERKPSLVYADVRFNLSRFNDTIKKEWDALKPHDVVFLISLRMEPVIFGQQQQPDHDDRASGPHFRRNYGIRYVRGGEVVDFVGQDGHTGEDYVKIEMPPSEPIFSRRPHIDYYKDDRPNLDRTLRIALDTSQYYADVNDRSKQDAYDYFTILVRRKPKENNFKAVLETIRDLMQSDLVVPDWFQDVLLGYGDPASAHYSKVVCAKSATAEDGIVEKTKDFRDTFLNWKHLVESFAYKHAVSADPKNSHPDPPYIITFPASMFASGARTGMTAGVKRKLLAGAVVDISNQDDNQLMVQTYSTPNMGPYPEDIPRMNAIKFTPRQVEAIHSGMSHGLTVVVGPPGTGKTDVAVQIIANIYHNHPDQHTLIVTHSNQALNQLFQKIMALDIDPRHLLRLGHGQEELLGGELGTWSKSGRVEAFLEKRLELLAKVEKLANSICVVGAHGSTCETASYFYSYHVLSRWEPYHCKIKSKERLLLKDVVEGFPFSNYFLDAPEPLFSHSTNTAEAVEVAEGCWRHLSKIFQELEEVRAFELLRSARDRGNYLLMKEARIVAMTCTHAALKRREMVALGFKYENVLMEEAAQILEVETFIPLLLQSPDTNTGVSRLRRVILIGDHHQLPPVIQHTAFQRYGNMEQSMFSRFVRLGVPSVELDQQARARPSIAELFRWNYSNLGDLTSVIDSNKEFRLANPGLPFEYQCINVEDYFGKGETIPSRHVIQNMGEAEYAVALFMYMRLLGYPAKKIAILSTYKGQKDLINDILAQRCEMNPLYGRPASVQTVDKYQGQQSDFVILSLVRTSTVGFMRDVRRMIVAMSRARLGLYVLCRVKLLETCTELHSIFSRLLVRPTELWVRPSEIYSGNIGRTVEDRRVVYDEKTKQWKAVFEDDGGKKEEKSFEMAGLSHLGSYISQMYEQQKARIAGLQEAKAAAAEQQIAS
ncbi:hypothetical protein SeMB42_g02582 [Synchytrium endobioticum]|uniref:Pre-mRNA-splicing factor n=1 Tax=Synchytrium endobioticum TaxID=286115 RepID=A0A507DCZ6_9FUNG|nr:hypothetical protein SeMB42_g02582 [Synchytrium endobioticum]TPX50913.1 hypothetical protein SeLEV6574_g00634 [Synchytrium endobioticum]